MLTRVISRLMRRSLTRAMDKLGGRVVSGMHIVHSLVPGDVIERVRVDPAPARATLPAAPTPPAAGR
jgi:hypothetical protein